MKDLVIKHFVVTFLLLVYIESSVTLDCYQCTNVAKVTDCQNVVTCSSDESCYTDTTGTDSSTRYTLGCRTKQICRHPYSVSQGALIGRAVTQDLVCSQCCGVDLCNYHVCASSVHGLHTTQCADEPNFNCQQVSELFNVCNDQDHAKLVCRKFCDLCDIVDGYWLAWSSWSTCSHTCGNGMHSRTRACNKTEGGLYCTGDNSESQQCLITACPVDGGWTYWSSWSSCSVTCGSGFVKRDRHCTNPSPGPSGLTCAGYSWDVNGCLLQSCTDGTWTAWSDWGTCSATCQGGITSRTRQCNTTTLGHSCVGKDDDYKVCNTQLCAGSFVNGGWTLWSSWSACSAYCMSERTRTCSNPVPSAFGKNCLGNPKETKVCNQEYCSHLVRLVDGNDPYEGRLEVYHNGHWGTVCNNNFTNSDADVVCRMLKYDGVPVANMSAASNQGILPILLDNVSCSGTEESLFNCKHLSWGDYYCEHSEEVSLSCHGDIQVRLEGGTSNNTGRVEFSRGDNVWGSVCDIGFDKTHAEIVCKMLSMSTNKTIVYVGGYFSNASGASFVTDIACSSSESNLGKCGHFAKSGSPCNNQKNVGIACVNDLSIRLADGTRSQNGRVEVSVDGNTWGRVCDPTFNKHDASAICRTLGYSGNESIAYTSARFGSGTGQPILSDLGCSGSESSLADCNFGVVSTSCSYPAGVDCVTDMNVRLVNGSNIHSGRVVVSLDSGNWGPMCDRSFNSLDAKVVCRTLGYPTNLTIPSHVSRFGQGTALQVLTNPDCSGTEDTLVDCTFSGSKTCSHSYDVGVDCIEDIHVRLVNGTHQHNGRVELSTDGHTWGPVCNENFDINNAKVICKTLGYPTNLTLLYTYTYARFGQGTTPNILPNPKCSGSEMSLADCQFGLVSSICQHTYDVSVECVTEFSVVNGLYIRLVDGTGIHNGRVEISENGSSWGTICDDVFDTNTVGARVVCKMLGYPWSNATVIDPPPGNGPILLDDIQCTGSEISIMDCHHITGGVAYPGCSHAEDVGVSCA